MAGFIQDPIQFVNLIADNLRDRYQTGFPVLKELIQNTDDAPATELHYGLSSGLPSAIHPLLKGPGLFLINNGEFKPSDARGIRSFGQNSKAADQASIGKFGLGMKSVFHFCETFFFLAHDGNRAYAEVLNPWSGADSEQTLHRDWDEFSEQDAQTIRRYVSGITKKISSDPNQCFILWLPLRKKDHLYLPNGERAGAIVSEYPGDDAALLDFLDDDSLGVKIAALIPMLRHVKRAAYWKLEGVSEAAKPHFDVILGEGAERPSLVDVEQDVLDAARSKRNALKGRIRVIKKEENQTLEFSGYEYFGWNSSLAAMHGHELWPSSYVRDDLGHSREAKDKARPHGAVFFSRTPGNGQLVTNWSVFLPLDEAHASEAIPCDGSHVFRLTLHGYFFIDAGRQGVHGLNECDGQDSADFESEEALRRAWNCELLHTAVLPLLLPALDAFCSELPLADKARTALSEALNQTTLLRRFRGAITAQQSWFRELTKDGVKWALRNNEKKILNLPAPPEADPNRPWRLFQSLKDMANKYWLSVAASPNIVNPESVAQWGEQDLLDLFGSVDGKSLFSDSTLLDYFASFLEQSAGPYIRIGTVNKKLGEVFKTGMIRTGEDGLGKNQQRVRDIVSHIDEKQCFRIENNLPSSLLKQLFSIDIDVVLVPARFYPAAWSGTASLSINDASQLLRNVQDAIKGGKQPSQEIQKAALSLSEQIIKGVAVEQRKQLLQRCADLHILGAYDCKSGEMVAVSLKEIESAREDRVLFGFSQSISPQERLGLAPDLQKILPNVRVLLINAETAKLALNQERAMSPCNGGAVLRTLGQKVRTLGDLKARAKLAGSVSTPSGEIEIRGLRFLLHADTGHFDDDDALWILGEEQHPVWRKLWAQLVENEDEPWNLVAADIADRLSRDVARQIGIREVRSNSVIEEIAQRDATMIDSSGFSEEECDQILRTVKDDRLWYSLPFHWTPQGKPVRGNDENVYLDSGVIDVDEELLLGAYLIPCSSDSEVLRRQKALLRPLDESAIIELALRNPTVKEVWRVIADALHSLNAGSNKVSPVLGRWIKEVAWVPTSRGELEKPDDIIDLEAAEVELDRILAQVPNTFTAPSRLDKDFLGHPFYPEIRERYLSRGQEGIDRLALVLADLDTYQIGGITLENSEALREAASLLSSYEHPGWRFLSAILAAHGDDIDLSPLVSSMSAPMSLEATVNLLNWIAGRGGDQAQAVRVFNRYLEVFAGSPDAKAAVCRLKLLSQAGRWQFSNELVSDVIGVAKVHVLDQKQAQILANLIYQGRQAVKDAKQLPAMESASETQAAAGVLRDYFNLWSGRVAPSITGLFVLLFGADKLIKSLCGELLGQHSREWLVEQVPWKVPQGTDSGGARTWLFGFSFDQALEYFHMTVRVHGENSLQVSSILGESISVGLEEGFSTLLVGRPSYHRLEKQDGYRVDLVIRKIAVEHCSDKQLSTYLRNSTAYILREVFNQLQPRLDELWNELDKSDQVDIELARSLILQNIPFYLKQLGVHKYPILSSSLNRYRDDERKEKEFAGSVGEQTYRKRKEESLIDLQRIIESDEGAQQTILESVRRKIRDFQYQVESVPFEIFQNADDALHDLELIDAYPATPGDLDVDPLPASICRFAVDETEERLVFMHWGRAINQFGSKGFPGRDRGYDRDLENMLILSASDKGEDVTGKFGLGFKSVWLISDRPTVVSGRLQTEIIGGLLPMATQNTESRELLKRMSEFQPDSRWPGTGISLPLVNVRGSDVLDQFVQVAGVMVAFARNIRAIDIDRGTNGKVSASWEGRLLPGCENIYVGHARQAGDDLLVLRIVIPDGALLLSIGTQGFEELPKAIPNLWVTAPIREQERIGFAINAMFEVDAGRSRLSASVTENKCLANRLGSQLALELDRLHNSVTSRWEDVSSAMQLAPGLEPYHLWATLWKVLMARLPQLPRDSSTRVIATDLIKEGLQKLAENKEVIPNGLPGELKRLIKLSDAKTVLKDALSEDRVLQVISETSCFQRMLDTRTAVSSELATWLRILFPGFGSSTSQWRTANLTSLIAQLDSNKAIDPSDANILGKALNSRTLDGWQQPEKEFPLEQIKDLKLAAEKARDLRFRSAGGTIEKCKSLLTEKFSEDEALRWAFSPDNHRFAKDYDGSAVEFFLFCRDKLEAPAEKLKDWIIEVEDSNRRRAALEYLIKGELASQVANALHEKGIDGTWLVSVGEDSEYLMDWDSDSRSKLIYQILKTPSESRSAWYNYEYRAPSLEPIDAKSALNRIYEWWESARAEELDNYRKQTYPEGLPLQLEDDNDGAVDRSSWLVLLLLGGFHTMGRTQPEQHRRFIENCQHRGWWEVFTDPVPAQRFNDWMGVLDQYIDQQVDQQDYEQWMMRFPIIYKLSRHLDDFVELLLGLERYRRHFDLDLVLSPLADADQQGGGIAAPPLGRTLGMGANFVIRELIRNRVIDSSHLRQHAYVPYQRVRRLFYEMGCENIEAVTRLKASPLMQSFLTENVGEERASFCGDFDIPLKMVSEDWGLQQELLGRALTDEEVY